MPGRWDGGIYGVQSRKPKTKTKTLTEIVKERREKRGKRRHWK